jgi:hypothetical protein
MIRRYLDLTVAVLLRMYFGAYLKLWMPESDSHHIVDGP